MKIKSIKLHNFMRYKGDNELCFSTDSEKNVTVVLGDNTFGKTTLAQAFRWALYEKLNDTNYTKTKDIVLLNNEVVAAMKGSQLEEVSVQIDIENGEQEIRFVRKAQFNRKSGNPNDLSIKQIGITQLTMQIREDNIWGDVINDKGENIEYKKYKDGCVQDMINNLFPPSLSNYFFFDGERWNDTKSKTADIKKSVDTILGVSGLLEMTKHFKEGGSTVVKTLRDKLKGTDGEYERLQREIKSLDIQIEELKQKIKETGELMEVSQHTYDSTLKTLNDNRKIEEDQKELTRLEKEIEKNEKFKASVYSDIVKALSDSAKYFTSAMLSKYEHLIETVDLEGKDIPGVTVDTLDYLINSKKCLCGSDLVDGTKEYDTIMKLREQVPPEMLGGAAGKLKDILEDWKNDTNDIANIIKEKASLFDSAQDSIDEYFDDKMRLEKTVDRKTNLGPVRMQNQKAKEEIEKLRNEQAMLKNKLEQVKDDKVKKESQFDVVASYDSQNAQIYRCLVYVDAMYDKALELIRQKKNTTLTDLNKIIGENFKRMFNDNEKYAALKEDYKIHVFYHQLGDLKNYEEETLSNGETIAINFVFIVSILELAKQYREYEKDNKDFGMENAILGLPLVLDGPFSALSNENTNLVANRLPQFAEQVIIFMLDKDWEASGLDRYTLPEYCYRVNKEFGANCSSLMRD